MSLKYFRELNHVKLSQKRGLLEQNHYVYKTVTQSSSPTSAAVGRAPVFTSPRHVAARAGLMNGQLHAHHNVG